MRLLRHSPFLLQSILLLVPTLTAALNIDCKLILVNGISWKLDKLDGPHSVKTSTGPSAGLPYLYNTTYTIDPCKPLKKPSGVPKEEFCQGGSRVCGIKQTIIPGEDEVKETKAIPIAGNYITSNGGHLDPKWTRLKTSDLSGDKGKEGLRLSMEGKSEKDKRRAVVEFLCSREDDERRRQRRDKIGKDDYEGEDEVVDDGVGGKLKYVSYELAGEVEVLNLEWTTQYACEDAAGEEEEKPSSGHWGFFTWLIIIFFLGTAAYLIFGSWLNYNRYSARGWDLLPHSETIRDIPYLLRDWMRRVVNTVQGGGSRGGYSAV